MRWVEVWVQMLLFVVVYHVNRVLLQLCPAVVTLGVC